MDLVSTCGVLIGESTLDFARVKRDLKYYSWFFATGMCRLCTVHDRSQKTGVIILYLRSENAYLALCCSDYKQASVVVKLRTDHFYYVDINGRFAFVKTDETVYVVEFPNEGVACDFFHELNEKCRRFSPKPQRLHQYIEDDFVSTDNSVLQHFEISDSEPTEKTTCCAFGRKIAKFLNQMKDFENVEKDCPILHAEELAVSYADDLARLRRRQRELSSDSSKCEAGEHYSYLLEETEKSVCRFKLKLTERRDLDARLEDVSKNRERFYELKIRYECLGLQPSVKDQFDIYRRVRGLKPICNPSGYKTAGLEQEERRAVSALEREIEEFESMLRDDLGRIVKDEVTRFFDDQKAVLNGIKTELEQLNVNGTMENLDTIKAEIDELEQLYRKKFTEQHYIFNMIVEDTVSTCFRRPVNNALKRLRNLCREVEVSIRERNSKRKSRPAEGVEVAISRLHLYDSPDNEMKEETPFEVSGQRLLKSAINHNELMLKQLPSGLEEKEANELVRLVDVLTKCPFAIRIRGYVFADETSRQKGTNPIGIQLDNGYVSLLSVVMEKNHLPYQIADTSTSLRWVRNIVMFSKFAISRGYSVDGIELKDVAISSKNEAHIWEFGYCKALPEEKSEKDLAIQKSVRSICIVAWEIFYRKPFTLTSVPDPELVIPEIGEIFAKKLEKGDDISLDELLEAVSKAIERVG